MPASPPPSSSGREVNVRCAERQKPSPQRGSNDEDGAEFNDISHHIFTTVSVSRHIRDYNVNTSRPARVWRVTRPEPEATRATHRQETKIPKSEQDVRVVMRTASNHKLLWTSSTSFSSLGDGREYWYSYKSPPPSHPRPAFSPSAHILWYVSPRRPPRQSNRSNRLFRSPTHPVATSTKRYRDVHRAVN